MTFDEFKQECIDRQKRLEINQFLHLYIKATTYVEILQIVKQAGNFQWSLRTGVIDMALLSEVPSGDLLSENIYSGAVTLTNVASQSIYLLDGANLTLTQSGTLRCKVFVIGGTMTATANDKSMIEVETFLNTTATLTANDNSYLHLTAYDSSVNTIDIHDDAILKLNGINASNTTVIYTDNSFINSDLNDDSRLQYTGPVGNTKIRTFEQALATAVS